VPNRPLVSIVTPTLNQAQFLEATLRSVREQTYPNIEHIVVDGGSTDGTLDILEREATPERDGLRWQTAADRGMYDAINKGLALAKGEILAYLNSDDLLMPWAVETVVAAFERQPSTDMVFGDGVKVEQATGDQRLRLFPPFDHVSLANYESLMQPAVFWRRRVFERIGGFDTDLRYVADLDYWLRAGEAGIRVEHVDEVLALERIHAGRLSTASREAMATEDRGMRDRHAGDHGGAEGRSRAVTREIHWQRRLWRRFELAWLARRVPLLHRLLSPWPRFLRLGDVHVDRGRIEEGSQAHHYNLLRNAVVSGLAARLIGATIPPLPKRRASLPRRIVRRGLRTWRAATKDASKALRYRRGEAALRLTYRFSREGRRSRRRLRELRDTASGRCVIIGNGPSLNSMDLSVLAGVPAFALNRGHLLFPRIGAPTPYLASVNRHVLEQSAEEMLATPTLKFFNWRHRRFLPEGRDDVVFIETVHQPGFSTDVAGKGMWEGATVTFVAMQLAFHLGYRDIVIIGVDHSFTTPGPAHQLVTSTGADPNHFDPNYFGAGYRWQLPDLETSEVAYRMAKAAFESAGGSIVDATAGGKLTIYPKADFTELYPNPASTSPASPTRA
jgi:glycosyltransferase involved in cell wall biosynthesis